MGSQYCNPTDLIATGVNPLSLIDVSLAQQVSACLEASSDADSYMRGRYALPLSTWGPDIRGHIAVLAVWKLLRARGLNPAAGGDVYWQTEYLAAIHWFEGIQRQSVHPDVTPAVAQPGDPIHDLPQVHSDPSRGWQQFSNNGTPSVS